MIKVGIVGATGYTGVELLRLLAKHPKVKIELITSRAEQGNAVANLFPNLRGYVDLVFSTPDVSKLKQCDVVFFATPNGTAMTMVPELLEAGVKIIDLAADFRLKDPLEWKKWYAMDHSCPELLDEAVYGLPEINRSAIKKARLVANPGCYPTAVQLGFLPLIENNLTDLAQLVADAKSGVSGAGRGANVGTLMAEMGESLKAYGVSGHRHLPEICQGLNEAANSKVSLTFVPHLIPMIRGIHATLYATVIDTSVDLQQLYETRYRDELFVDVLPSGVHPETRFVRGSNMCRISIFRPQGDNTVVILSVIDNLVKGASGQAVQNMNLMFDLAEDSGLDLIAIMP
ncbi:MAG: N-acetyl-gamma-glutamyl-phosphate reductase [Gammaproteobacteria bacterium]